MAFQDNKVTDKKARVILAAYNTMEMILRMLRPEKEFKNVDITDYIRRLSNIYETTPVENMLSHLMERNKVKGTKEIIQNPTEEHKSKVGKALLQKSANLGSSSIRSLSLDQ